MRLAVLFIVLGMPALLWSQSVGVNTPTPDPSAVLDVSSVEKGVLLPRLTTAQRDNIAAPADGLLIYNITTHCFNFWNGSKWIEFCASVPECSAPPQSTPSHNAPLCVGQSLTLNASAVTGATYVWTRPDGTTTTGSSLNIPGVTKADSGTYTLRTWALGCYSDPATAHVLVQDTPWRQMTAFPGNSRIHATAFTIGAKGYIGSGATAWCGGTARKDIWSFDPSGSGGNGTWTNETTYPGNGASMTFSFVLNDRLYMGAGFAACGTWYTDVREWDPVGGVWTSKTAFPAGRGASFYNVNIGNMGYWGMGEQISTCTSQKDLYRFDPTASAGAGSWTVTAAAPAGFVGRHFAVAFVIGGKLYVGYGHNTTGCPGTTTNLNTFYEYDPGTNGWTAMSNAGGPPAGPQYAYFATGGYGYVIASTGTVYRFNPAAGGTWTTLICAYPGSSAATSQGQAFVVGGKAYVVNTNNGQVFEFTP
ncbi:MAG: hypothetical protein KF690_10785 [Bacteroidetes bacterium]|nr:hypothetical protein [Bacteroidota bacterium]